MYGRHHGAWVNVDAIASAIQRGLGIMHNLRNSEKEHILRPRDKQQIFTHPFLSDRDRRWPEALPAALIDKSLLLLSRSLIDDSSNSGHRICLETEIANHEPWNMSKTNTVSE